MSDITVHGGDTKLINRFEDAWMFLSKKGDISLETSTVSTFRAKASVTNSGSHKGEKTIRFMKGNTEYARSYPCCWATTIIVTEQDTGCTAKS